MKSVAVRELQHNLKAVLAAVERGETILIRRRNRPVARLVPAAAAVAREWPDAEARLDRIYGDRGISPATSDLVYSGRGD